MIIWKQINTKDRFKIPVSNHPAPKPLINDAISITENHAHHGVTTVKRLNTSDDSAIIKTLLNRSYNIPERNVSYSRIFAFLRHHV